MKFLGKKTPQFDSNNIHELILAGKLPNKAEPVKVNGYSAVATNDKAENIFLLFALQMSSTCYRKMWNQMENNWNLATLFEMQYINLVDGINHDFMSIHEKV